ncbi:DUF6221 family protein [Actinoplanes teichomyceticus]|uniref:Uncharacterized protein n=1 Tax=Actinoplanes teichomyceticus TaxID=1867 RepID=A0A561WAQ6_ACTTI|nr:DUF6221 family protein [Actinoplanes teichomyceticus]TWG20942.1 hypothetical protein FHX34_103471 [Actinoplanes teichomyceticus]GIF16528.1 hypothetical protein Ate01nite_65600 [Actinoplanes teichomyceticus]
MTGDLIAFLRARLDEDEQAARAAAGGHPHWKWDAAPDGTFYLDPGRNADDLGSVALREAADHIVRWNPARVLAEVEAKRALLNYIATMRRGGHAASVNGRPGAWTTVGPDHRKSLLRLLAQPYADHPDYPEELR